jgi:CheY-like chemotaxis protein
MIPGIPGGPIEILLVEDNPGDVRLTRELLSASRIRNTLHAVSNGVEAMAYLRRTGRYAVAPRPDLVLLDLNLPRKDGREVLAEMKQDQELRRIPVVVLTGSKAEEDVLRTYDLHANCYVTKPIGLDSFASVIQAIEDFWLSTAKLPPAGSISGLR